MRLSLSRIGQKCTAFAEFELISKGALRILSSVSGLVGGHAAIGEDEAGHALRREVVDEVLHPGEVGVALGRNAELMNAPAFTLRVASPCGLPLAICLAPLGCQRTSSSFRNQSESLKGGLART